MGNLGEQMIQPFEISTTPPEVDAIRRRVANFPWHESPDEERDDESWQYGASLTFMRRICAYWVDQYDWSKAQRALNRHKQFIAAVGSAQYHFYFEVGSGPAPQPLILSHGWPGSIVEFVDVIEPLAHPERFGGDVKDAFTVVVPSLPGFGWSQKPPKPIGPRAVAKQFDALMTDVLGQKNYIAQGGDFGSIISSWMALEGRGCAALHLNLMGWSSPGVRPETPEEIAFAERKAAWLRREGGYLLQQASKPQTLSYAMMDSPVGVCAWFVEKFHGWSNVEGKLEDLFSLDLLITNVMVYLLTRTFNTATWMYPAYREEMRANPAENDARITKPVGIAPIDPMSFPPRTQVERSMNVVYWSEASSGGHFASLERPDYFVEDLRRFAAVLRG